MYRAFCSFVLALALALSWGAGVLAETRDTIRLTNGESPPLLSKDAPHHGIASHIVTEAFARVGVEVEYGFFPWKRSYKLAKEGKWDGSAVWWDKAERHQYFLYSDPVIPTKQVLFHLKRKAFDWNTYEDLKDVRIGGTLGYTYGPEFEAAETAGIIETDRGPSDEIGLRKLLKGRIDVFPGDVIITY